MALPRYVPQLDGVRALAIACVVAYHLGYLNGGWLGVDVFFVLSGYLITSILLDSDRPPGSIKAFWGRRVRRLLPAVLVLLVTLSVYAWAGGPGLVAAQLRAPALATLFYVANWQQIAASHNYFTQFLSVSPLQQTWSLAIEEQYYLAWPLLVAAIFAARARRGHRSRAVLLGVTLAMAVASAVWMGVAAHRFGPDRAYLGTDTRAWELLLGGVAAMVWPPRSGASRGHLWSLLTTIGLLGVVIGTLTTGGPPWWVWDGGLVALAVCATLLIVGSVRAPDGVVGRALTLRPLRWLGIISYSLYLWHWPVIVLMTTDTTGLAGWVLLVARLGTMLAVSCASFYLIERPLRRADWSALGRSLHIPAVGMASAGVLATMGIIVVGTVGGVEATTAPVSSATPHVARTVASQQPLQIPMADPNRPYPVWIFGDSVMYDSSLGLIAALQSTGDVSLVENSSFPGWGLGTVRDWPTVVQQTLDQRQPQIAIGTWSWDDQEAQADPVGYRSQLESLLGAMLAPVHGVSLVVLLQFPPVGPDDFIADPTARRQAWSKQIARSKAWDDVASQAVMAFPGRAIYLTDDQLFAPDLRFLTWMRTPEGKWVRARKLDNAHMCPYGAALFGANVTEQLTPLLHLGAMKPGWEYGTWTQAPRYNDPPGACPADQPPARYRGLRM